MIGERRREIRLTTRQDDLLVEAAGLAGLSVADYVVGIAVSAAALAVDGHRTITLDEAHFRELSLALTERPRRNELLAAGMARSILHPEIRP
jgi:uncharacterized protein (DUF1778 family)